MLVLVLTEKAGSRTFRIWTNGGENMIREVKVGQRGSKLRGVGEITRAVSDGRRLYADMYVDYDKDSQATSARLFTATIPVTFQLRINELAEVYVDPKKSSYNELRRIRNILAKYDLLELNVDVQCGEDWDIRVNTFTPDKKSMSITIGLPERGAFCVEALETCRCYIVGRGESGDIFMVDSLRGLRRYGLEPF